MLWLGDPTFLLLIPAILLSLYAQWKVGATFKKYARVRTRGGQTGAEVAQAILRGYGASAGLDAASANAVNTAGVRVEYTPGTLSDHYDPRARVLRLSDAVYGADSVAAVAVAAHEAGHALQHAGAYPFLALRSLVAPVASIGSSLAFPIVIGGMIFGFFPAALNIAILLYIGVVAFTVITLPVEFNASARALRVLENGGYLSEDELPGARAVLNAAALTYVAATASAVIMLVRLLLLRNMSRE
ncbi:MAG: putative neutral zinc metallopeptidase [bacterium ADurb.Bin429]|nr:MAG: putative neutral zinc metallopeptidase [bacterium ADurb.Bin429]